jgi:hypothetical protein
MIGVTCDFVRIENCAIAVDDRAKRHPNFGLLHVLGCVGALAEIWFSHGEIPLALSHSTSEWRSGNSDGSEFPVEIGLDHLAVSRRLGFG